MMFPHRTIYIWFVLPIPARWLVLILFVFELLVIGSRDGVAHFAHVGGAITGWLYLRFDLRDRLGLASRLDPVSSWRRWRRPRLTVHPGGSGGRRTARSRGADEAEVDRILDKISTSGLESLTSEESRTLQEASRRFREEKA